MTITHVFSQLGPASPGAPGGASNAANSTGADILFISVSRYGGGDVPTVSDSKGNTWTPLTESVNGDNAARIYYALNPTVGTGHTFTVSGTAVYPTFIAHGFAGAALSSAFDAENGTTASSVTSVQPGSITPAENGEVIIANMALNTAPGGAGVSINSGFTIGGFRDYSAGVNIAGYGAYFIQTTAAAINPTWSWTDSGFPAVRIASFKAAAVAGGHPAVKRMGGVQFAHSLSGLYTRVW